MTVPVNSRFSQQNLNQAWPLHAFVTTNFERESRLLLAQSVQIRPDLVVRAHQGVIQHNVSICMKFEIQCSRDPSIFSRQKAVDAGAKKT